MNLSDPNPIEKSMEIQESFLINPNPKFNVLPQESITLLHNTPISTRYSHIDHQTNGGTQLNFSGTFSETNFLDRGAYLSMEIPLVLTKATNFAAGTDGNNYFSNSDRFKDIAIRQYGLLSAIDTLTVSLNGNSLSTVTNVSKAFEMVSEYYSADLVNKYFPNSQPDRFTSYDDYDDISGTSTPTGDTLQIRTLSEKGEPLIISKTILNEENVFNGGYSSKYNSRKPTFTFRAINGRDLHLTMHLSCYLPFSIFGLPNADFSLYGISEFTLDVGLKSNFVKHLIVFKNQFVENVATPIWSDVNFDTSAQASTKNVSRLHLKTYDAPDYIRKNMVLPNAQVKPYRFGLSTINFPGVITSAENVAPLSTGNELFYRSSGSIILPKSVYLSVHAVPTTRDKPFNTPNFKGRITQVRAVVGTAETVIGTGALKLFNIAVGNGLDKDVESAMYTNGYVLKLDLSSDLSVGSYLIGSNVSFPMTFDVTYDSLASENTKYELRVLFAHNSQIIYKDKTFRTVQSLIISESDLNLTNQAATLYGEFTPELVMIGGSGFFGKLWKSVKKLAGQGAKAGWNYIKNNPDKVVGLISKAVGAGGANYHSNVIGGNSSNTINLGAGRVNQSIFK